MGGWGRELIPELLQCAIANVQFSTKKLRDMQRNVKICRIHRGRGNPHAVDSAPDRAQVLDSVAKEISHHRDARGTKGNCV